MNRVFVFLGILIGIYFTYFSIHALHLSAVISSCLAGIFSLLPFFKKLGLKSEFSVAIYCGSFAGMGCVLNAYELLLTAILVWLLMLLFANFFKGFGGKLGLIAYVGSVITELIILIFGGQNIHNLSLIKLLFHFDPLADFYSIISVIIASTLGFYTSVFFHHYLKKGAIFSSAFPSLIIGLLEYFPIAHIELFTTTFFSASFAGMLAQDLILRRLFIMLIMVHFLTSILVKNNLGEYGGALGVIAFFSVFIVLQIYFIALYLKQLFSRT
ncbi:hypothetical protein [Helicobacter cetorum]|uniref:hypothetical protein n=1 Tax=Helicobacter cetorum TaxID=138563 RepID=UPI001315302C|nr:hypothetical protein [Helicobacter cetorum]